MPFRYFLPSRLNINPSYDDKVDHMKSFRPNVQVWLTGEGEGDFFGIVFGDLLCVLPGFRRKLQGKLTQHQLQKTVMYDRFLHTTDVACPIFQLYV